MRGLMLILIGLLIGFDSAGAHTVEPAVAIDRVPPDYPDSAGTAEGSVKLQFTISAVGQVKDIVVVESTPSGLFDAAARTALVQWRYKPSLIDGKPADQQSSAVLRFKPDIEAVQKTAATPAVLDKTLPTPMWPTEWRLTPGQWVELDCTLGTDGRASDITIIDRSNSDINLYEFMHKVRKMRFDPILENGIPVEKKHQRIRLHS